MNSYIKLVEKLYRCESVGRSFIDRYGHKYTFMFVLFVCCCFFCLIFFVKDKKKFNKVNKNNL